MSSKIEIDGLAAAITKELSRYSKVVDEKLEESADAIAKDAVQKLKTIGDYEDISGKYRKSFRIKDTSAHKNVSKVVYASGGQYRLTHLLEKGHAIHGGTRRTRAFPHWKPVEEESIEKFEQELTKQIEGINL